jgi:hypothetical protein
MERMRAFWNAKTNAVLYVVGQLLAVLVNGKTLAQHLLDKAAIPLKDIAIPVDDKGTLRTFPLASGYVLSLETIGTWGCPACHSAHGSGVAPSRRQEVAKLESNVFYYNPATRELFTISASCYEKYCAGVVGPKAIEARITKAPAAKAQVAPGTPVLKPQVAPSAASGK